MKRMHCLFIFSIILNINLFAQENKISEAVNECVNLVGKEAPNNFTRIIQNTFMENDTFLVGIVENNIIISSALLAFFDNNHDVKIYLDLYYELLDQYWYDSICGIDIYNIYLINEIYVCIHPPFKLGDGNIAVTISFSEKYKSTTPP
jgi:hypothetical protein